MKHWKCTIKEKGHDHLLTPEWLADDYTDENDCVKFWGLNNDDVEWYKLELVEDEENK